MFQPRKPPEIKKIIAIAAGKGGVGKSTLTVQLADALANNGYSVGVLDCDLYGPSIRRLLPEFLPPNQEGEIITPAVCRSNIKMLSLAYFYPASGSTSVRAPIANGIIQQFLQSVQWGDLDYLLVDFPPGTGDIQLTLAQKARFFGAVLITTPQEVALMDVRRAKHLFDQMGVPLLGVVENMSYLETPAGRLTPFGKNGGAALAREFSVPLLTELPLAEELCRASDQGQPLAKSPLRSQFEQLARQLATLQPVKHKLQLAIARLYQKSTQEMTIEWSDGVSSDYRLSDLQHSCPCAACRDEATGERRLSAKPVHNDVEAVSIDSIGHYALKIHFSSGCSNGIYPYTYLRPSCRS